MLTKVPPDLIMSRRQALGIKQIQLAKQIGVCRATVSEWEAGNHYPRWPVHKILCEILGLDPITTEVLE